MTYLVQNNDKRLLNTQCHHQYLFQSLKIAIVMSLLVYFLGTPVKTRLKVGRSGFWSSTSLGRLSVSNKSLNSSAPPKNVIFPSSSKNIYTTKGHTDQGEAKVEVGLKSEAVIAVCKRTPQSFGSIDKHLKSTYLRKESLLPADLEQLVTLLHLLDCLDLGKVNFLAVQFIHHILLGR